MPKESAAAKTDSAMGHYIAGIATNKVSISRSPDMRSISDSCFKDAPVPEPQAAGNVPGRMIALDDEPQLAEDIAAKAQTATNPAAADHFS